MNFKRIFLFFFKSFTLILVWYFVFLLFETYLNQKIFTLSIFLEFLKKDIFNLSFLIFFFFIIFFLSNKYYFLKINENKLLKKIEDWIKKNSTNKELFVILHKIYFEKLNAKLIKDFLEKINKWMWFYVFKNENEIKEFLKLFFLIWLKKIRNNEMFLTEYYFFRFTFYKLMNLFRSKFLKKNSELSFYYLKILEFE